MSSKIEVFESGNSDADIQVFLCYLKQLTNFYWITGLLALSQTVAETNFSQFQSLGLRSDKANEHIQHGMTMQQIPDTNHTSKEDFKSF